MYVLRLDAERARWTAERQVTAVLAAAGAKGTDGKPMAVVDPDEKVQEFLDRLRQPLDSERRKKAVLKAVQAL